MPLLQIGTATSYCKLTLAKIYYDAFSVFPFFYIRKGFPRKKTIDYILWPGNIKSDPKWMLLLNNCYKIVSGHFFAVCIFIFHKTEVQTVILRCLMGLYLNLFKSYGLKCRKTQIFPFPFLCDFVQKHKFAFFVFLGFGS